MVLLPPHPPAPDPPPPDCQKIRAFFSLFRPNFRSFCLSGGLLVDFCAGAVKCPPGLHTTAREPTRAHLRVFKKKKKHQHSTKRHRDGEKKNENGSGWEPPGFHTTTRELQTCTFDVVNNPLIIESLEIALLASLSRDEPVDGKSRSSLMSSMIEEADAKRRCVATSSAFVLPSRVGNQA